MGGAALTACWRELIEYCIGKRERRGVAAKAIDAAHMRGDSAEAGSIMRWRYGQKIEIKSAEAVAAPLHGIVAPGAAFLCDERCQPMARGATAERLRSDDEHVCGDDGGRATLQEGLPAWRRGSVRHGDLGWGRCGPERPS